MEDAVGRVSCVREFHLAFEQPAPPYPTPLDDDAVRLRMRLIREEYEEVMADCSKLLKAPDLPRKLDVMRALLKELADLRYVLEGTAVAMGMDIDGAYAEVHRSNMSKLGEDGKPIRRADGKALKGPNYSPADMTRFVPEIIEHEAT